MSRLKLQTLQSKVEYIILSLGGKPDEDTQENRRNLSEFEMTSTGIKDTLNVCKDRLKERQEKIKLFGYQSRERILLDEELKAKFSQAEEELQYLRELFKRYQEKNKRKVSQKELEARSRGVDLLRRNLNLLQDEFKDQVTRMRKDVAAVQNPDASASGKHSDFIDIFGTINRDSGQIEEEREELYDDERDILKQFEENDKELEDIAAQIVNSLDELKGKAQTIESSTKRQGDLLKKTRRGQEDNEARLKQQNNQLRQALERHKNGKQICLDVTLLLIFVGLLGVLIRMLKAKGYM